MSQTSFEILLVEDEESHAMLIERAFDRCRPRVGHLTVVGTLAAARDVLGSVPPPGLAIIDAHLPDGPGIDLLSNPPPCPMVVMTSQEHTKTAREARERGALDYVVKSPQVFRDLPEIARRLIASLDSAAEE